MVDRFADYLVVQVTALAMAVRLETILSQLVELLHPAGIVLRTERDVAKAEGLLGERAPGTFSGTFFRDQPPVGAGPAGTPQKQLLTPFAWDGPCWERCPKAP